jgi:hypothetical protein
LAEKHDAKERAQLRVTYVPSASFASSTSLDHIANTTVAAPKRLKHKQGALDNRKVNAVKAASFATKKPYLLICE